MNSSGAMHTGWLQLGSTWYYLKSSGAMATGTQVIGGRTYVFNSRGILDFAVSSEAFSTHLRVFSATLYCLVWRDS